MRSDLRWEWWAVDPACEFVTTGTALLVGGLIAGGAGVASAAMGSHAAGKAADQQAESADKALALQREMYQQQRADTAVHRNAADQATTTLSGLMGLRSGPVQQPYNWGPPPGSIPNQHGEGFGILQPGVTPEQARDPNFQYQRGGLTGLLSPVNKMSPEAQGVVRAGLAAQQPQALGSAALGAQAANASGYATMQSPDGKETQQVPVNQVAHYEQMGARRVG